MKLYEYDALQRRGGFPICCGFLQKQNQQIPKNRSKLGVAATLTYRICITLYYVIQVGFCVGAAVFIFLNRANVLQKRITVLKKRKRQECPASRPQGEALALKHLQPDI